MTMKASDLVMRTKEELEGRSKEDLIKLTMGLQYKLFALVEAVEEMDSIVDRALHFSGKQAPPEDEAVARLCKLVGYGAVMDSASRQWFLQDKNSAFLVGPCRSTFILAMQYVFDQRKMTSRIKNLLGLDPEFDTDEDQED